MTGYLLTPEGIRSALQALGDSAEQVAQTLAAGGHRGVPSSCGDCPVARYLGAVYPGCEVSVGVGRAHVVSFTGGPPVSAAVPISVAMFIAAFDEPGTSAREYLELRDHPFAETGATS